MNRAEILDTAKEYVTVDRAASKIIQSWTAQNKVRKKTLAYLVPVLPNQLSRWLSGRQIPKPHHRARLSQIIGHDLSRDDVWGRG
jgi:hypothetical protein